MHRVVFYEITRNAIRDAVGEPRGLSLELVNAQQARRALDYLVGFNLSPLLWKKVRQGLSAGRVQSPALRMICEREEEIEAFKAQEYWTIEGEGAHSAQPFPLKLLEYRGRRSSSSASPTRRRRARSSAPSSAAAAGALHACSRSTQAAAPQSRPALHHLHAAAGGRAQARLQRAAHHAARAAAVRGHGHRRGQRRPHHLHAHRLGVARRRGGAARSARSPRGCTARTRSPKSRASTRPSRRTPRKRTRPSARPRRRSRPPTSRASSRMTCYRLYSLIWKRAVASQMSHAVFDTVAVDMLRRCRRPAAPPAARQRLHARQARLHLGVPGRHGRRQGRTTPTTCCRRCSEGDTVSLAGTARRAAFHRAAAALSAKPRW